MRVKRFVPDRGAKPRITYEVEGRPKEPKLEPKQEKKEKEVIRISELHPNCDYYKYRKMIIGKSVRPMNCKADGTGWYRLHDDDRMALNSEAGWSANKQEYFFLKPKLNVKRS